MSKQSETFHADAQSELSQFREYLKDSFDIRDGESTLVYATALLRRYRRWEEKLSQALSDRDRKWPIVDGLSEVNREWYMGEMKDEDAPIAVAARIIGRSGR
jgi:hypothetical protein